VIEPSATYRFIKGVNNFRRILRCDHIDTISDTNEIEYGLINQIYTRKYAEAVTGDAQQRLRDSRAGETDSLSVQPYEIFTHAIRGKYFFDETFGGALVPEIGRASCRERV